MAVARALAMEPKIILADEPVSALDKSVQAQVLNLFHDLQKEFGISIIFISHDLSVVEYMSDHIAVLYLGEVIEYSTSEELYHNPRHPYTKELLRSIPQISGDARLSTANREPPIELPSPIRPPSGCRYHPRCPYRTENCSKHIPAPALVGRDHIVKCHRCAAESTDLTDGRELDMKKYKMLFAGESWLTHNMEVKGWDDFSVGGYGTEIDRIHAAMDEFAEITHLPSHLVGEKFPSTMEELKTYDVVILSDVGANTLLLHPLVFTQSVRFPNRLQLLADYVEQGGALGMMGGYMTFQGIGGKGCYHGSPIEKALPVDFLPYDDRQEHPEGIDLKVDPQRHPALKGLPEEWPYLLGYNKAVAKPGAQVAVEYQGDPILSFYEYGKGRSFAWASDCAPHWMPPAFCEWEYIHLFWKNMIDWVVQR